MSAAQIGGMIGAVIGLAGFFALRWVADRMEQEPSKDRERTARTANILRLMAIADIIVLAAIGYFVGPLVLGRG